MFRLLADEDFNDDVLAGLMVRRRDLDIVRVKEVGLVSTPDPVILDWAAQEHRILLTHDKRTMIGHAYARVAAGQFMPGVCAVTQTLPIGEAIQGILLLLEHTPAEQWENQVLYVAVQRR